MQKPDIFRIIKMHVAAIMAAFSMLYAMPVYAQSSESAKLLAEGVAKAEAGDSDGSLKIFKKVCDDYFDKSAGSACYYVGLSALNGLHGDVDAKLAYKSFEKSCGNGSIISCMNVMKMKESTEKRDALTESCKVGDAGECNKLGVYYYSDSWGNQDLKKSRKTLDKACEMGSQTACDNLKLVQRELDS